MKLKQNTITLITIIVSILIILGANSFVMDRGWTFAQNNQYDIYKGTITKILSTEDEIFNLGDDIIIGQIIKAEVKVLNGDIKGETVVLKQEISPFFSIQPEPITKGDKVLISQSFVQDFDDSSYDLIEYYRGDYMMALIILFAIGLIWFGKKKGGLTIVSLVLTCMSIFMVFIPSILNEFNIYTWSISICIFIILMTLFIVNGFNIKTFSAGIGCISGVAVAGVITFIMNHFMKITGMIDDESVFLQMIIPDFEIDLKAIIFASIIIGAVGAIMDVAISIASAMSEMKQQNASIKFNELYKSGIEIGKDIMGTMTNTLVLAYIGSALSTILLLLANASSIQYLLNTEMIIVEILQSVVGSLGILLTLPLTSLVSAFLYSRKNPSI